MMPLSEIVMHAYGDHVQQLFRMHLRTLEIPDD